MAGVHLRATDRSSTPTRSPVLNRIAHELGLAASSA
jgi:hypothetical protein